MTPCNLVMNYNMWEVFTLSHTKIAGVVNLSI